MSTIPPPGRLYRFSGLDATAVGLYVAISFLFGFTADALGPLLRQAFPDAISAAYAINLGFYLIVGIFAALAAWRVIGRDLRILATRPWFTLLMVPVVLVVTTILTAILVAITGPPQSSGNQIAVQGLVQDVPAWLVIPLLVFLGPFVEEYLFRHLLIGKLSRRLNIWVCCALSVFLFAAIHVVAQEGFVLSALMPYLGMGVGLVAAYMWTGRNVMFTYFVHATKNLVAVVLIYAMPPEVIDQLAQLPT